jgi:uncharacterized protein
MKIHTTICAADNSDEGPGTTIPPKVYMEVPTLTQIMKKEYMYALVISLILMVSWAIPYTEAQSHMTITAPAVERTPDGLRGILSYITVSTQPGSGHIYIDTWPLAEVDIQGSARLAVQVACEVVQKDWHHYDFFITVRSESPIIGGPSAGGAMAVAVIAALQGWELDSNVVMSGTINPDETVGPVGGLYQKAEAASKVADFFLVPEGQTTVLVEEQDVVQKGPFHFVTTTQSEVDLVEEGRKMGLEIKEIYDIRDAVFYLTGKRIEVPLIESEPIKADFMKSYSREELEIREEEYNSATERIASYNGSYRGDLEEFLDLAHQQIDYAHEMYDAGNYYTSMNANFVAGCYITFASSLLSYVEGVSVEEIFLHLDEQLDQLSEEIKAECPMGMTSLQCIATAQQLISETRDYYQQAQEKGSDFDYIEYASYAQRRVERSKFWLNLSREYQKGSVISETTLKNAASAMINMAELSLVYASSVLPESNLLQEAEKRLEAAQREFSEEVYCASLFSAIESKIYGEVALITYASDESMIEQRVERARERASNAIEKSRERGIEPVLAVSYYELAESSTSSTQILIRLGYAEETASIYKYIESQPESSMEITERESEKTSTPIPDVTSTPESNTEAGIEGLLLFLSIGIILGIGISWIALKVTR